MVDSVGSELVANGDAPTVSLREAAAVLGVSKQAVTKRLLRGTLFGEKVDGEWRVVLPTGDDGSPASFAPRGIDLALAAKDQVIAFQQRRIDELAAELAVYRAADAEMLSAMREHVLALTAGPKTPWWRFW